MLSLILLDLLEFPKWQSKQDLWMSYYRQREAVEQRPGLLLVGLKWMIPRQVEKGPRLESCHLASWLRWPTGRVEQLLSRVHQWWYVGLQRVTRPWCYQWSEELWYHQMESCCPQAFLQLPQRLEPRVKVEIAELVEVSEPNHFGQAALLETGDQLSQWLMPIEPKLLALIWQLLHLPISWLIDSSCLT